MFELEGPTVESLSVSQSSQFKRDIFHERQMIKVLEGTFVQPITSDRPTIKVLRGCSINPFHLVYERQDEKGRVSTRSILSMKDEMKRDGSPPFPSCL